MAPGELVFDGATHSYQLDGQALPSVTQVLKPLYGDLRFVQADVLDFKSALGVAVHRAVELDIVGLLDESTLCGPVSDYFAQWRAFVADTGYQAQLTEVRVWSRHGYAGTLDQIGILGSTRAVVDLKTVAALSPVVALQTEAYRAAYNEHCKGLGEQVQRRYALRLSATGYDLTRYPVADNARDLATFLAFLRVHDWCKAKNKQMDFAYASEHAGT